MFKGKYLILFGICSCLLSSCGDIQVNKEISLDRIFPWIKDLNIDDIKSVINEENLGSVSPTLYNFNRYTISDNEEDLKNTYDFLKNTKANVVENQGVTGGISNTLEIYLNNNERYEIFKNHNRFTYNKITYEYINNIFPSFNKLYGNSFTYSTNLTLRFVQDEESHLEQIIEEKDFLSKLIFKEIENEPTQVDYYAHCKFILEEEEIHIIDDKTFKVVIPNSDIKIYQIINENSFNDFLKVL